MARGEPVLVVESDKADMDVESFQEGFLAAVLMPAGSTAPVGETIGLIVESQEEIKEVQSKASAPSAVPSSASSEVTASATNEVPKPNLSSDASNAITSHQEIQKEPESISSPSKQSVTS